MNKNAWEGGDIENEFRVWYSRKDIQNIKSFPLNISCNRALQENPPKRDVEGILHLYSTHYISFKVAIWKQSSNFYELMTLK